MTQTHTEKEVVEELGKRLSALEGTKFDEDARGKVMDILNDMRKEGILGPYFHSEIKTEVEYIDGQLSVTFSDIVKES
jgi:hypothetical protein